MNSLITGARIFGPFKVITPLADRLLCDGVEYQFNIIGNYSIEPGIADRPEPVPAVPESVPILNAEEAMRAAGWLQPWLAILAAWDGDDGEAARIKWARARTVRRDDPLVAVGAAALGRTVEEVDALFIAAAALNP
jgi:hypothetical protein